MDLGRVRVAMIDARRIGRHWFRLLAALLVLAAMALACAPKPGPSRTPPAPAPTPSPTSEPTPPPVAGVDWGEPVRLPGSEFRAGPTSAVSYEGRLIVAGSVVLGDEISIALWSSQDGIGWSVDMPATLSGSRATGLIVGPDGLVLAGTQGVPRIPTPGVASGRAAVWTSQDGRAWASVAAGPEFDRGFITDIASDGSSLLAVGSDPAAIAPDSICRSAAIWRSADGRTWEAIAPPETCASVTSVAGHDGRFVVLGQVPDPHAASDDPGATIPAAWLVHGDAPWQLLDGVLVAGGLYTVLDGPGGFVVVRTHRSDVDSALPWVLGSPDGETWTTVDADIFERGSTNEPPLLALGSADAFFVGSVRSGAEGLPETELWRSLDGRAWTHVPESAALNRAPPLTNVVLHNGSVFAFGGRLGIVAWASPPAAAGPTVPELLEPSVAEAPIPGAGVPRAVVFSRDAALAVGSERNLAAATVSGRVWRWDAVSGWQVVAATGIEDAQLSALARGPAGWVAIGEIRRAIGPDPNQGAQTIPHAWMSADGQDWTAAPLDEDHLGVSVSRLTGIVSGGPGYVAVGHAFAADASCGTASAGFSSVVLTSADGVAWALVDDPDFACSQINGIAAADGRLVAIGAETRIATVPGTSASPCDPDVVCLGGTAYSEAQPVAWVSTDARQWDRAGRLDAGWGRTGFTSVAFGPGGFVATRGNDSLFVSPDGQAWTPTYIPIGQSAQTVEAVTASRDGYLALGVNRGQEPYRFPLFFSADGKAWQELAPTVWSPEPGTFVSGMAGADGAGFLVVGTKQGQPTTSLSWHVALPGS